MEGSKTPSLKTKKHFKDIEILAAEHKKLEEELKENEKLYQMLFDNSDDGFMLLELIFDASGQACDFRFLKLNSAYQRQTGSKAEDVLGKKASEVTPDLEPEITLISGDVLKTGKSVHYEAYNKYSNKWYDSYFFPYAKGQVGILFRDITERKKNQEMLKESEEKYRALVEATNTGFLIIDKEGRVIDANKEYVRLTGHNELGEILGRTVIEWTADYEKQKNAEAVKRCVQEGFIKNLLIDYVDKNGKITPVEINAAVVHAGQMIQIISLCRDRTEYKEAEDALRVSEEKYREYVENSPVAFFVINSNREYVQVNNAASELLGYSKEELLEMTTADLVFEEDKLLGHKQRAALDEYGKSIAEFRLKRKDGQAVYVILNATKLADGMAMAFCENITERKKAEEALRLEKDRFRSLADSLPEIVFETDINGKVVFANQRGFEMTGYTKEDLERGFDVFSLIVPQDKEKAIGDFSKTLDNEPTFDNEYIVARKDGSTFPVIVSTSLIVENQRPVGLRGLAIDITERKKLEKQLQDNERLASIGKTAGMVGHDIRNPLQAMISDVYLLRSDLLLMPEGKMKDSVRESFDDIENNILYVNKIVADLLDYAKPLNPDLAVINFADLLVGVFERINIPDNIELSINVNKLPTLKTDATFIQRVLTNLVNNSIQAMPDGGKLDVSGFVKEGKVYITVSDNGAGIAEEVKPKLFTPMMTTKSKGQGLGLAVVKRLVEALDGKIFFESQVGKGTKFIIELPLA